MWIFNILSLKFLDHEFFLIFADHFFIKLEEYSNLIDLDPVSLNFSIDYTLDPEDPYGIEKDFDISWESKKSWNDFYINFSKNMDFHHKKERDLKLYIRKYKLNCPINVSFWFQITSCYNFKLINQETSRILYYESWEDKSNSSHHWPGVSEEFLIPKNYPVGITLLDQEKN